MSTPWQLRSVVAAAALALASSGLTACDAPAVSIVGQRSQAIVNGTSVEAADGYRAVGALVSGGGSSACTATLIDDRTVLTAAHCVYQRWPVEFYLDDLSGPRYSAASVSVHPSYGGGNLADVAIVRLARPVTGVEPMPLAEGGPRLGETVTLLGYGKTGEGEGHYGEKRQTTSKVAKVFAELFTVSGGQGNVCDGDSGGPTLVERDGLEVLLGVHSTKGAACGAEGNDMRVDAFRDWILHEIETGSVDAAADATAPELQILTPANDARVGESLGITVSATDDVAVDKVVLRIDGQVAAVSRQSPHEFELDGLAAGAHQVEVTAHDPTGNHSAATIRVTVVLDHSDLAFGEPCASGDQCQSRICAGKASGNNVGRFCSRSCSTDTPCGDGFSCVEGLCQLRLQASFGEACDASVGCAADGLCARDELSGQQFCTRTCQLDAASSCPAQSACTTTDAPGDLAVCVPAASTPPPRDGEGGGCAVASDQAGDASLTAALIVLLALAAGRRRRNPLCQA